MKGKKEFFVLAVIILAVVAYLIWRPTDRSTYELPVLAEVPKKEITKIDIVSKDTSIIIQRRDNHWVIGPDAFPADKDKINRILEIASELNLTAMVSESKNDPRYDLSSDKRIQFKAWAGDSLKREFDVGKAADTFRHTFVKIAGDDRIFHAENNFRDRFDTTIDDLRNKTVMAFESDEITSFKILKDGKTANFVKKKPEKAENEAEDKKSDAEETETNAKDDETKWVLDGEQIADPKKVTAFLSALSDLKCKSYIHDFTKEDLTDPVTAIILNGEKEYRLSIHAAEKSEEDNENPLWPSVSSENDYPFFIADWKAKDVNKNPLDLMPDKPKAAEVESNS